MQDILRGLLHWSRSRPFFARSGPKNDDGTYPPSSEGHVPGVGASPHLPHPAARQRNGRNSGMNDYRTSMSRTVFTNDPVVIRAKYAPLDRFEASNRTV